MAIASILMIDGSSDWQLSGHFIVFGLSFGAVLPLRAMVMSRWYSGAGYGRTMGAQWAVASLIGAAGPAVVGLLHDSTGGYQIPISLVVFLLAGAAFLVVLSGRAPAGHQVS
jgi:cyanate permease